MKKFVIIRIDFVSFNRMILFLLGGQMEQVKFYSKEDMASGYNLSKVEKIIDSFDEQ